MRVLFGVGGVGGIGEAPIDDSVASGVVWAAVGADFEVDGIEELPGQHGDTGALQPCGEDGGQAVDAADHLSVMLDKRGCPLGFPRRAAAGFDEGCRQKLPAAPILDNFHQTAAWRGNRSGHTDTAGI